MWVNLILISNIALNLWFQLLKQCPQLRISFARFTTHTFTNTYLSSQISRQNKSPLAPSSWTCRLRPAAPRHIHQAAVLQQAVQCIGHWILFAGSGSRTSFHSTSSPAALAESLFVTRIHLIVRDEGVRRGKHILDCWSACGSTSWPLWADVGTSSWRRPDGHRDPVHFAGCARHREDLLQQIQVIMGITV